MDIIILIKFAAFVKPIPALNLELKSNGILSLQGNLLNLLKLIKEKPQIESIIKRKEEALSSFITSLYSSIFDIIQWKIAINILPTSKR